MIFFFKLIESLLWYPASVFETSRWWIPRNWVDFYRSVHASAGASDAKDRLEWSELQNYISPASQASYFFSSWISKPAGASLTTRSWTLLVSERDLPSTTRLLRCVLMSIADYNSCAIQPFGFLGEKEKGRTSYNGILLMTLPVCCMLDDSEGRLRVLREFIAPGWYRWELRSHHSSPSLASSARYFLQVQSLHLSLMMNFSRVLHLLLHLLLALLALLPLVLQAHPGGQHGQVGEQQIRDLHWDTHWHCVRG